MKIYYFEASKDLIHKDLSAYLSRFCTTELMEAPSNLKKALHNWDEKLDLNNVVLEAVNDEDCKILIACNEGSKFQKWCLNQCAHAHWGCSNGLVSVDYSASNLRLCNQIHECLHFLGVNDCYEENTSGHPAKSTCNSELCVMRYGVASTEVCSEVLRQLNYG